MKAITRAIETDGANVTVNGGIYDCSYSDSATFWIQNSTNSSFNYVKASGAGWVLNAIDNSVVNVVGGSYSSNKAEVHPDRPTLRASNNATLNVTNADVTGTYCDVFVTGATANLFGGTYTNTNEYINHEPINYESPALKVWRHIERQWCHCGLHGRQCCHFFGRTGRVGLLLCERRQSGR